MSDQSKVTVTIKADQAAPWIVVNGETVAETHALLNDAEFPNLAILAAQCSKEFTQVWGNERAGLQAVPGTAQVQQQAAPAQQQAPPQAQPQGQGVVPVCQHGEMTFRSGVGKGGKAWKAYFCSAAKGDPSQCDPQWIR